MDGSPPFVLHPPFYPYPQPHDLLCAFALKLLGTLLARFVLFLSFFPHYALLSFISTLLCFMFLFHQQHQQLYSVPLLTPSLLTHICTTSLTSVFVFVFVFVFLLHDGTHTHGYPPPFLFSISLDSQCCSNRPYLYTYVLFVTTRILLGYRFSSHSRFFFAYLPTYLPYLTLV
ncbi:hypothetical protein GALMADRAFT_1268435 [Galerina marginata CBS 339.88]|uniref:Uncharacterized protein n=1 Tax=Galerina marginata (strain CBS 339.88) TaxID=685588 RepID=A0A067T6L1_GALM3|nr:hypothetical protein GALMADRAFT_1268435 [Galerina marginata CBS 339.88]